MTSMRVVRTSIGLSGSVSIDSLFLFTKSTMESWNYFLAIPSTSRSDSAIEDLFFQDLSQVRGPLDLHAQPVSALLGVIPGTGLTDLVPSWPESGFISL